MPQQQNDQDEPADLGRPASAPPVRWYRRQCHVHVSTGVVTLLAAAIWVLVILAPERRAGPDCVEHGWPWRFLTRDSTWAEVEFYYSGAPEGLANALRTQTPALGLWSWTDHVRSFDPAQLVVDSSLAVAALAILAVLLERRRRRLRSFWQLSLREVAAIVLLAAIPCAWWGSLYRQAQRQAAALAALDGVVARAVFGDGISSTLWQSRYEVEFQTKGNWFLELFWDEDTKPRWFAEVVSLKLTVEQDAADEAVALIGQLPSLQELSVEVYGGSRRLSDESVQTIAELQGLRDLALRRIGGNWDLSVVGLSDAQVAQLARLTELESLDLSNNHVTDEGLRHLHGLKRLKLLEISNNPITDAGVSELTRSIPGLTVLDD